MNNLICNWILRNLKHWRLSKPKLFEGFKYYAVKTFNNFSGCSEVVSR